MNATVNHSCVLITGASSGLGREYALRLAPQVRHMVLVARREALLESLARQILDAHPAVEVTLFALDLSVTKERGRLAEELAARELVPDLLINNAGLGDRGEFLTSDWERNRAMLRVNIEALTHLTHLLLPGMIESGRGAVVNVSSLASLLPIPDFAVYAATKAYVTSFSEALGIELKEYGIPVLAVCPGPVHTGFGEVAGRDGQVSDSQYRECFYVPAERVVAESLRALVGNRARVYPGLRTAAAALVISVLPIVLLRLAMGFRPRKQ